MGNQKRAAQDALFTAIKNSAENIPKAALRAHEKVDILRELAEAYRLTAGGSMPDGTGRREKPEESSSTNGASAEEAEGPTSRRARAS